MSAANTPLASTPLSPVARLIFGFVALNALLGAAALLLFPSQTDTLFFWTITPPINAALLGALYAGGAVVVGWVTVRGVWESARFLIPVLVTAGAFISLTTLMHTDRFVPGIKLIYWLIVYIGAPLLAMGIYIHQERLGANWDIAQPLHPLTRTLALIVGGIILIAGLVIFAFPATFAPSWAWPMSPLMLRIFAAWFSAFGAGLLWFRVDPDWTRLRPLAILMIVASVLDLAMIFLHRQHLTATPLIVAIYCAHLVLFGGIGLLMFWLQRPARAL